MIKIFKMRVIIILLLLISSNYLPAQKISDNDIALDLARRSMEKMYNLETSESIQLANKLENVFPGHPASTFLKALNIYWKSMPIHSQSADFEKFHSYLQETLSRAEKLLEKDENNEEGIFFSLAAHGYLSQYYAEEKSNFKALKEAKSAYSYMKTGFNLLQQNPEFYYTTGLYNYYREQYPESHPGYKPFMWLFASGDKEKGLEQLEIASQEALFTKSESNNYAAHIYLRYENAPSQAEKFAENLVKMYPGNYLYRALYSETLLAMNKFNEAIPHIRHLTSNDKSFFNMAGTVYHAMRLEKQERKLSEAKEHYLNVIEKANHIPFKTDHYVSMAYCGLGRISLQEGNKEKAKDYFKKVLSTAHYPSTLQDAEAGLKKI